jgi:GNAT superfamily N-acetyltransferase
VVARIVADYAAGPDPDREAAWIAEVGGERAGCVFLVAKDAETAQLRILLVDPAARGRHLGQRLVAACIEFARRAGYRRMMLWTNEPLAAARHIYLAAGFSLISEEPHHSFGVDLTGQYYELDLAAELSATPR